MKIHLFIDRSIVDIFIDDKYATSIRVFPTGDAADGIEAFASAPVNVKSLHAWTIKSNGKSGIGDIVSDFDAPESTYVDVHNIMGACVKHQVPRDTATDNLLPGLYIIDGKKILVQ